MPSKILVTKGSVLEGTDAWLSARVLTADDTALVTGDCASTMSVYVYDITDGGEGRRPDQAIFSKTDITTSTVLSDTYLTTYWAGKDGTGYNTVYQLQYDAAGTVGPYLRGAHTYLVEFVVDASTGTDFGNVRWHFMLYVEPLGSV